MSAPEGVNQRIYEVITNPAYIGAGVYGREQYYFKDNGDRDEGAMQQVRESAFTRVQTDSGFGRESR